MTRDGIDIAGMVRSEGSLTVDALAELAGPDRRLRMAAVLDRVRPDPDATHVSVVGADGYRASIALDQLREGGWLALGADDGLLRLTVVEGSTLCWNVKGVVGLRVTTGPEPDDVPERPTH